MLSEQDSVYTRVNVPSSETNPVTNWHWCVLAIEWYRPDRGCFVLLWHWYGTEPVPSSPGKISSVRSLASKEVTFTLHYITLRWFEHVKSKDDDDDDCKKKLIKMNVDGVVVKRGP